MVYYSAVDSDAESGPGDETQYHLYEEIGQQGGAEAGPSEEPESYQYEEIDPQGDAEAGVQEAEM